MKTVQFLRYTFGARASEPISEEQQEFYRWLASVLSPEECTVPAVEQVQSVPSVAEIGGDGHDAIRHQITHYIRTQWRAPIEIAIVDIARSAPTDTIRPEWEMGVASAIASFITEARAGGGDPFCIVLKRARPTQNDVIWNPLLDFFFKSKHALIVDDVGFLRGHADFAALLNRDEYRAQLLRARHTPIDLLELKLIRRLGHVRVVNRDGEIYCARHFFDGTECREELAQLMREYIAQWYDDLAKPVILYTDARSRWLKDVVLTLEDCAASSPMSVDEFLGDKEARESRGEVPPLLIMPLIDTARTLASILRDWTTARLVTPRMLSVISTHGEEQRNGSWRPRFEGVEYEVSYILRRRRIRYTRECPLCRLEIPHQASGLVDQYLSLTAYDFWEMARGSDCVPEEASETPTHRRIPLRAVPRIRDMVHENGPWLAKKAVMLLQTHLGGCKLKGVPIVYLQEEGARPLPLYLRELLGATLIELPNWVRNELGADPTRVEPVSERLRQESPGCFRQLDSVDPDQPMLVLEEFSVSGGTRNAIIGLLHHLGRTVLAHLCVVGFEPRQARVAACNSFCLYDFELPKGWLDNAVS